MKPSLPTPQVRRALLRRWLAMGLLSIACALFVLSALPAPRAHADVQPMVTIALKQGASTGTQTVYTVTASGFAPQVPITLTLGDGSAVSPVNGRTSASGAFTSWWTLEAASKYCGTITAKTDTAQASASFWVAPASDPSSGTACAGTSSGGNTTSPPAAATATPAHAASTPLANATSPLPVATPTPADESAPAPDVRALVSHLPWRWIGLGGAAVLGLIVIMMVVAGRSARTAARRQGRERTSAQRRAVGVRSQYEGVAAGSGVHAGPPPSWRHASPRSPDSYVPHREPEAPQAARRYVPYVSHSQPQARQWPSELRPMPRRDAVPPRTREPRHPPAREPQPDQRWSRSQPGARTVRDATVGRQRAAPRRYDQ